MIKKIYSYLIMLVVLVAMACSDDSVGITNYTRKIDLSASTLADYQSDAAFLYSTDEGKTFVGFPNLSKGQTYQVKAVYNPDPDSYTFPDAGATAEIKPCAFLFDWSGSDPQPLNADATTGIATFEVADNNTIAVKVTDNPTPTFSVNDVAGTYEVVTDDWEDFKPGDHLTVEKIDDTHIRVVEYPATSYNHAPLVITITSSGVATVEAANNNNGSYNASGTQKTTTTGTGSLSSCNGTIDLVLKFDFANGQSYPNNALSLVKI